jgi:hypothetical protein
MKQHRSLFGVVSPFPGILERGYGRQECKVDTVVITECEMREWIAYREGRFFPRKLSARVLAYIAYR